MAHTNKICMSFSRMQGKPVLIGLWRQLLPTKTFFKVLMHFIRLEIKLPSKKQVTCECDVFVNTMFHASLVDRHDK